MNSFIAFSIMGPALFALASDKPSLSFSDIIELNEVCEVDYLKVSPIATCKIDNPGMSFEDKVRACTLKMRATPPVPSAK